MKDRKFIEEETDNLDTKGLKFKNLLENLIHFGQIKIPLDDSSNNFLKLLINDVATRYFGKSFASNPQGFFNYFSGMIESVKKQNPSTPSLDCLEPMKKLVAEMDFSNLTQKLPKITKTSVQTTAKIAPIENIMKTQPPVQTTAKIEPPVNMTIEEARLTTLHTFNPQTQFPTVKTFLGSNTPSSSETKKAPEPEKKEEEEKSSPTPSPTPSTSSSSNE